jgi:hypothetical protein
MTEAEWLACTNIETMLIHMPRKRFPWKWSTRKARLFAAACCRRIWPHLTDESDRTAIDLVEQVADKQAKLTALRTAQTLCSDVVLRPNYYHNDTGAYSQYYSYQWPFWITVNPESMMVARPTYHATAPNPWGDPYHTANDARAVLYFKVDPQATETEQLAQCALLRDIIGVRLIRPTIPAAWLAACNRTVPRLAQAIYVERAFDRLPILADALEEAGCDNADILNHCRQPGDHVRGCWVVDALLGKE